MSTDQNDTLAPLAQVIAATNPELLLGNAPDSLAREMAVDDAIMRNTAQVFDRLFGPVMPARDTPTGNDLGKLAKELSDHPSWKSPPNQTVAEATAALKSVPRRPLVMRFDGAKLDDNLKRRFALIGLEAHSDCGGEVHVRETRIGSRRARLEALQDEIARLRQQMDDDEAEYVMDEQASGDEK